MIGVRAQLNSVKVLGLALMLILNGPLLLPNFSLALEKSHASQNVRFSLPATMRLGDSANKRAAKHRIVTPVTSNLVYMRSGTEGIGLAITKGSAKLRLASDYVVLSFEVKANENGTFGAWDESNPSGSLLINLQQGKSYSIATGWNRSTRWTKFAWHPKSRNSKTRGMILTSITLAREVATPTPTATATPTPVATIITQPEPTATPIANPEPPPPLQCPGFVIEGFGKNTTGGCSGVTYTVTSLEDPATPIPGTLRFFVENTNGARAIKFSVAGTIALRKDLNISNGDLTIDGSDAPLGGVLLSGATVSVRASNVILRHLRFMVGPYSSRPSQADSLRIEGIGSSWVERVVVDHCSILWATDENLSIVDKVRDITIQWSIIAQGLYMSTHSPGEAHSMGVLMSHQATRMTMHHNLLAHNDYRGPQLASNGILEWINNVVYNPGRSAAGILQTPALGDENWLDAIGNYTKLGPNSEWTDSRNRYSWRHGVIKGVSRFFVQGNIDWNRTNNSQAEKLVMHPYLWPWLSSTRYVTDSSVTVTSAETAYDQVLNNAGATLPCRSQVEKRIIAETRNGTGSFVNYPSERGGYPNLGAECQ
jgi:pectate lyase